MLKNIKIIKHTIEGGRPALIADLGDGPEIYSDEQINKQIKILKQQQIAEVFGFIICSFIMTLIFAGLILIM